MTPDIAYVLGVTVVAMVLFVKEWIPADAVAILILIALVAGDALDARAAFQSFGNEALVTVAAMFILSAAITRTGAIGFVGRHVLRLGKGSEARVLLALMSAAVLCSAFVNNTPIAVIFLPMVLGIADTTGISGSRLLIPMSYATIVGGMCTVVGTSTNVLVSSMLPRFEVEALDLFAPLPLALIGIVMTVGYMVLVGRRLLPTRPTVSSTVRAGKITDYLTELQVPESSPMIGQTIADAIQAKAPGVRVLQLIRDEEILPTRGGAARLRAGDTLLVKGEVNQLMAFQRAPGIDVAPELTMSDLQARSKDTTLAELLVRPGGAVIGDRVRDLNLHARYGVVVLAVQRHGTHIRQKVADVRLRFGDLLLVQADAEELAKLRGSRDFVVMEGVQEQVILSHKAWVALSVMAAVMVAAAFELQPISLLALAGALAVVGAGCIGVRDAYRAIELPVLVLMAGTIGLGVAMERSGTAAWVAGHLVSVAEPLGSIALLSAIYLVCNVLTALISNAGAALLTLPIAIESARLGGLSTTPFVIAVMFAASIDFATPIGYQTNTFVYGPGGYRFSDYVKVGTPLNVLWWLLATLLIPVFWPL